MDEFQNFTTLMLANMLPELHKYGVGITLANQHLTAMLPNGSRSVMSPEASLARWRARVGSKPMSNLNGVFPERMAAVPVIIPG